MMYHVGKVLKVFRPGEKGLESSDVSTQALLEMWDENMFTCSVADKISSKIKEGDMVIVDYGPISAKLLIPKQIITKILRGENAKFLVHQGQEFVRSFCVPPFDRVQDACDVTHADSPPCQVPNSTILGAKWGECK
jgi:hypothetical protein